MVKLKLMFIHIKRASAIVLLVTLLASCTKLKGFSNNTDNRPTVPVTVQNATDYRPDPTVTVSLAGTGAIQIVLSIPASSGRTIKEITHVAASSSYTKIQGSSGFYNAAPIPGTGTTVTFTTSLTEYFSKIPVSSSNPAAKANVELANRFYFLVTLDDNSTIIVDPVRILVLA
jgi:hypothetical protein